MTSFALRFAVEIAFLALLALAAGLAELDTVWIVVVMAIGWLLVGLVEWLAWRAERDDDVPSGGPVEAGPEEQTSWDIEEILAPVSEEAEGPGSTTALSGDDR